jgi:hypothetical protein
MVVAAAATDVQAEDVGNIMAMEHVNVRVPDQALATMFYIVGLGLTRDPYMSVGLSNMWVNIGEQQFHLPAGEAQVLRGSVTLVVRDLAALRKSLASVEGQLAGTRFAWCDRGTYLEVTCPWGNTYLCHGPGSLGGMSLGIPVVEFTVPVGTAPGIQRFYERVLEAPGRLDTSGPEVAVAVDVGSDQQLVFRESSEVPSYDGHHIAIYVANFSGPFSFLEERGLITEGVRNHQLRFEQIVDPESGDPLFIVEHEVRSIRHPLYRRALVNRDAANPPMVMAGRTAAGT